VITIDDLRSDSCKSGFKYVCVNKGNGRRPTFFAEVGRHSSAGRFVGPRRETAEQAARDAADHLNGTLPDGSTIGPLLRDLLDLQVLRAIAAERATPRRTRRRGKRGRKTARGKSQRVYALARANGVCECGCGVEYEFGLDVHHVRLDAECKREGILWDSPHNVLAIRPDCHRRAHSSSGQRKSMFKSIDAIERPNRRETG
jgi:hypothetical protein